LAEVCVPGDRALLLFGQGPEFVVAFLGCLYAQVVAVPVNPPRRNRVQDATRAIVLDCEPAVVLTVAAMLDHLRPAVEPLAPGVHWLTLDGLVLSAVEPRPVTADTLAFLQYTSGSTSTPKGVMVSHGNLAANQEMIRRTFGHDRDSTVVGWAPFFHDQGLIGNVLQPLWVGATSVQFSAMAFARRPLLWLTTISRYRAHTSGGPNFAFDACVAAAARSGVPDVDLSSWQVAFDGAEPVRPDTLRRFAETFAPVGFDPAALHPATASPRRRCWSAAPESCGARAPRRPVSRVGSWPAPVCRRSPGRSGSSTRRRGFRAARARWARSGWPATTWRRATGAARRRPSRPSVPSWTVVRTCAPATSACSSTASCTWWAGARTW
jgi:hypothetical protein